MSRLQLIIAAVSSFSILVAAVILFGFAGTSHTSRIEDEIVQITETLDESSEIGLTTVGFNELKHDFGTIKAGEKVTHQFHFKNTGENPLKIESVKPSCGCTVTEWTRGEILPGETGFVDTEFNSSGKEGLQTKTVNVNLNTVEKNITLTFTAEVIAE